jgi:hypothetical protein
MDASRRGTTEVNVPYYTQLTPQQLVRLSRLGRELRLTDQILSEDLDTLSIVEHGPAPAWTSPDGDHVSYALDRMPLPDTKLDIAVWLGTNAHELGHVLFSPRSGSALVRRVIAAERAYVRGIADMFNIAEDQRQERLVLARFAPWRAYLTAALGHHIVVDDAHAWLLLAGRTWLPDAVRADARRTFADVYGEPSAARVAELIGAYQRLVDPGDTEADEAFAILEDLHGMFNAMPPLRSRCQPLAGGEPDTDEPGGNAPPTADEAEADGDAQGAQDGDDGAEGDDGADGAEGDAQDGQEGDGAGEPGDEVDGGGGRGEGDQKAPSRAAQITAGAAAQLDADDVAEDIAAVLSAIDGGRGAGAPEGADKRGTYVGATDAARRLHHEVGDALLDLKDANEPGWVRRVDSGRLNVRRLANPMVNADELFDRFEPGQLDANELEVVLLLDVSGSMNVQLWALAEATWAIRHAVDDMEGTATVITWDDGPHRVLAAPGDRPDERMFVPGCGGGTRPTSALTEAYRLLSGSSCRNRLMVILTDGQWHGASYQYAPLVEAMNDAGVVTVCGLLGPNAGTDTHGCTYGERLGSLPDLARLFGRVAASRIGAA